MKKHFFNMVEIALAMVVISLGITGILGLFSVGVNAKKAAINENNVAEFLKAGMYGAGIGGNLVNKTWIANGEFDKITEVAARTVAAAKG